MLYAQPPEILDLADCSFYHSLDLSSGSVVGAWDLRATIDAYLGNYNFTGKRALDVGTAGGHLAFAMEQRGAREVVAFEMASSAQWDLLPIDPESRALVQANRLNGLRKIRNGFWYAHRELGSKVLRIEGDLYDFPPEIGDFDVAIFGMILPHLRDPFRALEAIAPRTNAIIITQQMLGGSGRMAHFIPTKDQRGSNDNWWVFTQDCFEAMLGILAFEITGAVTEEHFSPIRGNSEPCTALVAERVRTR